MTSAALAQERLVQAQQAYLRASNGVELLSRKVSTATDMLAKIQQKYYGDVAADPDGDPNQYQNQLPTGLKHHLAAEASNGAELVRKFLACPTVVMWVSDKSKEAMYKRSEEVEEAGQHVMMCKVDRYQTSALNKLQQRVQQLLTSLYSFRCTTPSCNKQSSGSASSTQSPASNFSSQGSGHQGQPSLRRFSAPVRKTLAADPQSESPAPAAQHVLSQVPQAGGGSPKRSFADTLSAACGCSPVKAYPAARKTRMADSPQQQQRQQQGVAASGSFTAGLLHNLTSAGPAVPAAADSAAAAAAAEVDVVFAAEAGGNAAMATAQGSAAAATTGEVDGVHTAAAGGDAAMVTAHDSAAAAEGEVNGVFNSAAGGNVVVAPGPVILVAKGPAAGANTTLSSLVGNNSSIGSCTMAGSSNLAGSSSQGAAMPASTAKVPHPSGFEKAIGNLHREGSPLYNKVMQEFTLLQSKLAPEVRCFQLGTEQKKPGRPINGNPIWTCLTLAAFGDSQSLDQLAAKLQGLNDKALYGRLRGMKAVSTTEDKGRNFPCAWELYCRQQQPGQLYLMLIEKDFAVSDAAQLPQLQCEVAKHINVKKKASIKNGWVLADEVSRKTAHKHQVAGYVAWELKRRGHQVVLDDDGQCMQLLQLQAETSSAGNTTPSVNQGLESVTGKMGGVGM